MMHLMLYHGTQPLPDRDRRPTGRDALLIQIRFRQTPQDVYRLPVHLIEECQDVRRAIRQFFSMARITAGLALGIFGIHVALDSAQVPDDVGEAEFTFAAGPGKTLGKDKSHELEPAM